MVDSGASVVKGLNRDMLQTLANPSEALQRQFTPVAARRATIYCRHLELAFGLCFFRVVVFLLSHVGGVEL
jgi:hypothetical protein